MIKSDLVEEELSGALQHLLCQLNSRAPIWFVSHGEIEPQLIFADEEALTSLEPRSAALDDALPPGHSEHIATIALEFPRPLPYAGLREWLGDLVRAYGGQLLRVKVTGRVDG